MRTALICIQTAYTIGGVPRWAEELCFGLPSHGWRVVLGLASGLRFHLPERFLIAHPDVDHVILDARSGTADARRVAIQRAIKSLHPDIVIPTTLVDPLQVVAEMKRGGFSARLLVCSHEVSPSVILDFSAYSDFIDLAVGVSRLSSSLLERLARIPRDRVERIPYGVRVPSRQQPAAADAPLQLGFISRLDEIKRTLDLVQLADRLDEMHVPYIMHVAGAGELEPQLRASFATREHAGQVVFYGSMSVEDLYANVYPKLHCLLHFSQWAEGLPISHLEAMAHGVVPVTSDFQGRRCEGLIQDQVNGLVFPVTDLAIAASQVARLHQDRALLDRLAQTARDTIEPSFTRENMLKNWASALNRCLGLKTRVGKESPSGLEKEGRLQRFFTPWCREQLRWLFGRRYEHTDASEWPHSLPWSRAEIDHVVEHIAEIESDLILSVANQRALCPDC